MDLFNLVAKLTLDDSDYNKKLQDAENNTKKFSDNTEKNIKVIATNAWLQLTQMVLRAGQAIANTTLDLINYADKYSDLSAQYDMSSQSLQEFEYIASQSGTTVEQLLSVMTMMYNRAKENDEVFSKLGISVRDVNGNMKTMDTLFWEVQEAISNVENAGDRSALMLEAFGRNAMSVGEVLRRDSTELQEMAQRANDLGIVLEENTVQSASDFNDKLAEMKLRGQSIFAEMLSGGEGWQEKLNNYLDDVVAEISNNAPKFTTFALNVFVAIIKALAKSVPQIIPTLIDALLDVDWLQLGLDIASSIGKGIWQGLKSIGEAIIGKGWLWGRDESPKQTTTTDDVEIMPTGNYEVSERSTSTIEVKVSAVGESEISNDNAELIAQQLVPYINQALGDI